MKPTPLRDERAGELEHAGEDAADDAAEALDEAREVAESGGVEPWQEAACPVCRPGAVADGARPVRYVLHGGDDADVQPTDASASGFRLAGAGERASDA